MLKSALVVDEHPVSLQVVTRLFLAEGFVVQGAATGREALRRLQAHDYGVIAAVHPMAPISGWDLWLLSRKDPRHAAARFILVTTATHRRQFAGGHEALPVFLHKPFSAQMLREALAGRSMEDPGDVFEI